MKIDGFDQVLDDVSLSLDPGQLLAIIGHVGSGKSTLLSALIGEARVESGNVEIAGKLAYVSQSPWVQQATVRDNITFGLPFDQAHYDNVVQACALVADFQVMPDGDLTEIGTFG